MKSPLFTLQRGGVEEIAVHGSIVMCDGAITVHAGEDLRYPMRSLLKPFQFWATGLLSKLPKESGTWERFAPCMGSVSGTPEQIEKILGWYSEGEATSRMGQVIIPPSFPWLAGERLMVERDGRGPQVWYHNCFSKHMAILESCSLHNWQTKTYASNQHPYHTELINRLKKIVSSENFAHTVTDGCGLPTPVVSLSTMAKLYCELAVSKDPELSVVRETMLRFPEWIGGPNRVDTELMKANPGKLIAKEGADGLLAIAVLPSDDAPGLGIVVKLSGGYIPVWAALALKPILTLHGIRVPFEAPEGQEIFWRQGEYDISPLINEKIAVWPGDVGFSRKVSYDTNKGNHLTLSSIETTVHLGAHTDGSNHFESASVGISEASVQRYFGLAQVIRVKTPRGSRILPEYFTDVQIKAPRVLFRTDSFPDPTKFNEDFVSVSVEAIRFLAQKGVVLLGIDTPSIDPIDSKTLDAHHETTKQKMAILEGVILSGVDAGVYELMAVPLKLENADASPVRAILIRR